MDMLACRFNLDGAETSGRKVGFMDQYQIWCYLVDPFSWVFRSQFKLAGNLRSFAINMIKHFVPETEEKYEETRKILLEEFEVCAITIAFCLCNHVYI